METIWCGRVQVSFQLDFKHRYVQRHQTCYKYTSPFIINRAWPESVIRPSVSCHFVLISPPRALTCFIVRDATCPSSPQPCTMQTQGRSLRTALLSTFKASSSAMGLPIRSRTCCCSHALGRSRSPAATQDDPFKVRHAVHPSERRARAPHLVLRAHEVRCE